MLFDDVCIKKILLLRVFENIQTNTAVTQSTVKILVRYQVYGSHRGISSFQSQLHESRHESKSAVLVSSHYIVLNVTWNAILHILLWLVLTFYCWECTKVLSLTKLIYCFPVAIALWLLNFLLTIYVWKKSIKPILGAANTPIHHREHENEHEPESITTTKVYSTQL